MKGFATSVVTKFKMPCSSVFQINDSIYKYTYRCCLDAHDDDKDDNFHLSTVMSVMGVSTWNPNKYTQKYVIVHWKTTDYTISFLEPIFPIDMLTGERAGLLTGKASATHAGAYGARHVVTTEYVKDYFDVIWRS